MRRLIVLSLIISLLIFQHLTSGFADSRRIEASSHQSDRRIALVIGNADYKVKPLQNPLNDANSMSEALEKAGFEVMPYKNLNRKQMRTAIREFGDKLAATGGMGLFYYAGHGMEVGGKNYLIPVEADIQRITELEDEAVSADLILRTMEDAKNKLNLLVLDACRDNPFGSRVRSGSLGLAGMNPPTGVLVMYAAGKGKTADDGSAGNGVFTRNFIDNMFRDGLDIRIMLGKVAEGVIRDSNGQQSPHMEGMIIGEFSFRPASTVGQDTQAAAGNAGAVELQYWQSAEKSNTASAYRAYLKKYPNGEFAELAKEKLVLAGQRHEKPSTQSTYLLDKYSDTPTLVKSPASKRNWGEGREWFLRVVSPDHSEFVKPGAFRQEDTTNTCRECHDNQHKDLAKHNHAQFVCRDCHVTEIGEEKKGSPACTNCHQVVSAEMGVLHQSVGWKFFGGHKDHSFKISKCSDCHKKEVKADINQQNNLAPLTAPKKKIAKKAGKRELP